MSHNILARQGYGDDSAATNLNMDCRPLSGGSQTTLYGDGLNWGRCLQSRIHFL